MLKKTKIPLRSKCCVLGSRSGQLLVEMLVALGILTVGFLSVTTLLSKALGLNRTIADNYTATYLATEGIEITKNILDGNILKIPTAGWNDGFENGSYEADFKDKALIPQNGGIRPILFDPDAHEYGYDPNVSGSPTPFYRTIQVRLVGTTEVVINSKVSWTSRGAAEFDVNLEDHFFNWR